MRKPKSKQKPPSLEAFRLPASLLFGRPAMERPGGSIDHDERYRRYIQATEAYERDLRLALKMREVIEHLTPPPRGRQANPLKQAVLAEAERRRAADEPTDKRALFRWAQKKVGKNAKLEWDTFRRWFPAKWQ